MGVLDNKNISLVITETQPEQTAQFIAPDGYCCTGRVGCDVLYSFSNEKSETICKITLYFDHPNAANYFYNECRIQDAGSWRIWFSGENAYEVVLKNAYLRQPDSPEEGRAVVETEWIQIQRVPVGSREGTIAFEVDYLARQELEEETAGIAFGSQLDYIGKTLYDLPRKDWEPDDLYRDRIIREIRSQYSTNKHRLAVCDDCVHYNWLNKMCKHPEGAMGEFEADHVCETGDFEYRGE